MSKSHARMLAEMMPVELGHQKDGYGRAVMYNRRGHAVKEWGRRIVEEAVLAGLARWEGYTCRLVDVTPAG